MSPDKDTKTYDFPPLTEEERQRTREVLARLALFRAKLLEARGGRLFEDSASIIDAIRSEDADEEYP